MRAGAPRPRNRERTGRPNQQPTTSKAARPRIASIHPRIRSPGRASLHLTCHAPLAATSDFPPRSEGQTTRGAEVPLSDPSMAPGARGRGESGALRTATQAAHLQRRDTCRDTNAGPAAFAVDTGEAAQLRARGRSVAALPRRRDVTGLPTVAPVRAVQAPAACRASGGHSVLPNRRCGRSLGRRYNAAPRPVAANVGSCFLRGLVDFSGDLGKPADGGAHHRSLELLEVLDLLIGNRDVDRDLGRSASVARLESPVVDEVVQQA